MLKSNSQLLSLKKEMALNKEVFFCPICLDVLNDPVSIPCGHSYCMRCVKNHWDQEDKKQVYSCPECRESFSSRPVLVKNIMLAAVLEQLKTTGFTRPPADHCYAGPEDVPCDMCTGRKLKALHSCLHCLVSYCDSHLQPHRDVAVLQKHQLVAPSAKLQENLCSQHNKLVEIYCRTDQKLLCSLCSVDQHKGHDMVSSATERAKRQAELPARRALLLQSLKDKETDLERLKQEIQVISHSAQTAVKVIGDSFKEMVHLLEERHSVLEHQIRSEQDTQLRRVQELQDQLQQEVIELQRKISDLDTVSLSLDHNHFILHCPPLSTQRTNTARVRTGTQRYFENVSTAVSAVRDKLQLALEEGQSSVSLALSQVPVFLPAATIRQDYLQYSTEINLDQNTVHTSLSLSEGNRRATVMSEAQSYPDHEDRFSVAQVLSKQELTGRCYWEVEWSGKLVRIAVSYCDTERKGLESAFGFNDKSWTLYCDKNSYSFWSNRVQTQVSGPLSSRIGILLDHSAGVLSFYSVSETMSLLHRVQTTFTQPLFTGVGFNFFNPGDTAHFPTLK